MDYHINCWGGNSLDIMSEQPQGLSAPVADPVLDTKGSSVFEQTNLQVMMSSNNDKHSMCYENPTNASLLVPTSIHGPSCASKEAYASQLGSDHCTNSLPLSPSSRDTERTKKNRRTSETVDHIMSERRRRQELTKKFIALSATIPGLKKVVSYPSNVHSNFFIFFYF